MSRLLARVSAGWRTGLSGPVVLLQAGVAINWFGYGLISPFEIIYLHHVRGFPTPTAGLVLAAPWVRRRLQRPLQVRSPTVSARSRS